ncbi:MAG TPA: hypothetical protein VFW12_01125 [Candidatus Limnocylindria bacterium]|nr:hypothetical protein [Candidatus Limnocylindria bacterium]
MSSLARIAALALVLATIALPASEGSRASAAHPALSATCVSSVGPGIPPPARIAAGVPGFHAAWYGQSGYMSLCAGERATATVAYYNSGSFGWVQGRMGQAAYLGTWHAEPGQDQPSVLGGDGQRGSPATGWPRYDRVAAQPAGYVGPGQVAWFQFVVQAPSLPGTYRLGIRPLIEGSTWLEDFGVFWEVTVLNADGSAPRPTPGPAANVFYAIGEGVSAQDIQEVHEGVDRVATYIRDGIGGALKRPVTVRMYAGTNEAVCCLADQNGFRIVVDHRTWRTPPAPAPDTWSAATERKEIAGHEYVHVWQGHQGSGGCLSGPIWLVEGMPESISYRTMIRDGLISQAALDRFEKRWIAAARYVPLRELESAFPNDTNPYNVSWLAVDRVLAPGSQAPLRAYCERVGNGQPWRTAFTAAFGESVDSFYSRFEAYRAEFVR